VRLILNKLFYFLKGLKVKKFVKIVCTMQLGGEGLTWSHAAWRCQVRFSAARYNIASNKQRCQWDESINQWSGLNGAISKRGDMGTVTDFFTEQRVLDSAGADADHVAAAGIYSISSLRFQVWLQAL
jgi:hypothetical protein